MKYDMWTKVIHILPNDKTFLDWNLSETDFYSIVQFWNEFFMLILFLHYNLCQNEINYSAKLFLAGLIFNDSRWILCKQVNNFI